MGTARFITEAIANQGFAVMAVGDSGGCWAYTIGFTELGHPEILICGLRPEICHRLFWDMYRAIKDGRVYQAGEVDHDLANLPAAFRWATPTAASDYCCQAVYWYEEQGKVPQFLQLVLPDPAGLLPWQVGYDAAKMRSQRHLWMELH